MCPILAHEIYFCRVVAKFDKLFFFNISFILLHSSPYLNFSCTHLWAMGGDYIKAWASSIFWTFFSMTLWNITPSICVFFVTVIELLYVCFLSREIMVLMIDSITPINNKMWECDVFSSLMCIIINIILTVLIIHQLRWLDFALWQHISHPHWEIPSGSC